MRLTDIAVRALPLPDKGQRTYFDDTMPSFGIRVSQGGTRTFIVMYGPERIRKSIGRYSIISLAEARTEAKRILAEHTLGRTRPKTVRFDAALAEYFEDLKQRIEQGQNKPRTLRCYKRLINRYFNFGRRQLTEITHEDITRKLPKAPAERNHALVAIKIFLSWAQKPPRRYIPHNPCEGMTSTKRPARKRTLNDTELAAVLRTALENTDAYSRIVALLILTGQRRGEIAALEWPWISTQRTVTLPSWLTKNKTEHTFPYGDMAAAVIEQIPLALRQAGAARLRDHVDVALGHMEAGGALRERLGKHARRMVGERFLMTRLMEDSLDLIEALKASDRRRLNVGAAQLLP